MSVNSHDAIRYSIALTLLGIAAGILSPARAQNPAAVGIFEGHGDVGSVLHPGSSDYDTARRTYTLAGSGENMWFNSDNFQFAWKKISGDIALGAEISILGAGGNEHRKAALMIRQDLDADSAYADVAVHGDGLTSLQYRDAKGAAHGGIVHPGNGSSTRCAAGTWAGYLLSHAHPEYG